VYNEGDGVEDRKGGCYLRVLAHGAALVDVLQSLGVPGVVAPEHGLLASNPEASNTRTCSEIITNENEVSMYEVAGLVE
jgi:hypothetical protein